MLDITEAMAGISLAVMAPIAVEHGLIRPVKAELERWREAATPWVAAVLWAGAFLGWLADYWPAISDPATLDTHRC